MRCDFKVKSMEDRPTGLSHPWGVPWGAARNFSPNVWNVGANNSRSIPWNFHGFIWFLIPFFFSPMFGIDEKLPTWMQTETERNHSGCGFYVFVASRHGTSWFPGQNIYESVIQNGGFIRLITRILGKIL